MYLAVCVTISTKSYMSYVQRGATVLNCEIPRLGFVNKLTYIDVQPRFCLRSMLKYTRYKRRSAKISFWKEVLVWSVVLCMFICTHIDHWVCCLRCLSTSSLDNHVVLPSGDNSQQNSTQMYKTSIYIQNIVMHSQWYLMFNPMYVRDLPVCYSGHIDGVRGQCSVLFHLQERVT